MFPSIADEMKDVCVWSASILGASIVDVGKECDGVVFFIDDTAEDILVTEKKMVIGEGTLCPFGYEGTGPEEEDHTGIVGFF